MNLSRFLISLLSAAAVAAANPAAEPAENPLTPVIEKGQAASKALIQTLGGKLKEQLQTKGPKEAVRFCAENAIALTHQVSDAQGEGVSIKRVSLSDRNPVNRPEADEKAVLEALESLRQNGVVLPEYLVRKNGDGSYKFIKPLAITHEVCLKCHGTVQDPELAAYIKSLYPEDKGTGHKMGDLRGAIVVTIKP